MSKGKEKSGPMTVAMIGCLGTIVAAIITGIVSLIIAFPPFRPGPELPMISMVTPSGSPTALSLQAPATALTPVPPAIPSMGAVDVSGTWEGHLTYVLGDRVTNFRYQLLLGQEGSVIYGQSRIEKAGDPSSFAEYYIGAQFIEDDGQITLRLSETDLINSQNYTSFVPSDPIVAKVMQLIYSVTQGNEVLEGEWRDYVGKNTPDGKVLLSKQP